MQVLEAPLNVDHGLRSLADGHAYALEAAHRIGTQLKPSRIRHQDFLPIAAATCRSAE
jgi:hypothetical protein